MTGNMISGCVVAAGPPGPGSSIHQEAERADRESETEKEVRYEQRDRQGDGRRDGRRVRAASHRGEAPGFDTGSDPDHWPEEEVHVLRSDWGFGGRRR